ncbi:LCP family protein, partial [Anoxybacillus sp. LAT_38]|nr:LCP family protein [Anoxybacillus sp. LAT_38]
IVEGGPELAMETVSQFTGLPVNRYVITDFEGFKHLIDAVGGVELYVEKNMRYRDPTDKGVYDIDLKKGLQRLDGSKALQYVRFRHDATSDYTRTERQRKLMAALADQMKSGTTLIQLPSIL